MMTIFCLEMISYILCHNLSRNVLKTSIFNINRSSKIIRKSYQESQFCPVISLVYIKDTRNRLSS